MVLQPMPRDTHDWDATETAVLIDTEIDGRPRKISRRPRGTVISSCSIGPPGRRDSKSS